MTLTGLPATVLLIEGRPGSSNGILEALASNNFGKFELLSAPSPEVGITRLRETRVDAVLLDLSPLQDQVMPETFAGVQRQANGIPIVVLVQHPDQARALQTVQPEAQHYLFLETLDACWLTCVLYSAVERNRMRLALQQSTLNLQASETRLRDIIARNADGIIIVGRDGTVQFANPAAEALFNRKADELVGLPFGHPMVHGESAEVDVILRPGYTAVAEMRVVETVWEEHPAYLASLRDITEHKRTEQKLREVVAELQARNEELDAFAHTVAHDLQGSLGSILGFAQVLGEYQQDMPAEELSRHLRMISRGAHQMSNIIEELLVLAGARHAKIELAPLDMAEIVAKSLQRLAYLIEEQAVEIIFPETGWPAAVGYAPWVEEVWVNYLSNAIKYGGRPPRIELGSTLQADGMVRFWVRDNGLGLKQEEQDRLFAPFTRLAQTRAQGHGLGLSIVRRIVEKLGGQVQVKSEGIPGQGCTFSFTLPGNEK